MPELRNVFISHIHEDDADISDLVGLLRSNGMTARNYSITSDKENNAKSPDYIKSHILAPRIKSCSTLVVYITQSTKESKWVDWEIEYAHRKRKTIIGVWERGSRGCDIPRALEQFGDAVVGWHGNSIIEAINGNIQGVHRIDGTPVLEPIPIRRHPCN